MISIKKLMLVVPLFALTAACGQQAKAWGGPWGGGYDGCGGYCAGQADAQYDYQNNLAYNPIGECQSCHSLEYWDNFKQGYNQYWYSHQQQTSSQGASINIYGNNNYATINQYSNQQQNPLQQLGHIICACINCQNNQPTGYGPYQSQATGYSPYP